MENSKNSTLKRSSYYVSAENKKLIKTGTFFKQCTITKFLNDFMNEYLPIEIKKCKEEYKRNNPNI